MINNEFDKEIKYKLFRTVNEILHPTISKKNISDYKIIMEDDILPVRVFYPKQVTNIDKVIIYVHGNGEVTNCIEKYSDICKNFSIKTNSLVIAIEYDDIKGSYGIIVNEIKNCIMYLYDKLIINSIREDNIILMSDSTGCHITSLIKNIPIRKRLLFYPVLGTKYTKKDMKNEDFNIGLIERINKYFNKYDADSKIVLDDDKLDKMLILVGNIDMLIDDVKKYVGDSEKIECVDVPFSAHGFLNDMDKELSNEVFTVVNKFI
ncbi:MAG: alpha/beta hydrolase [Bacilli bacterium]|nr:alpha/beta hydrolase [Bacilli bacterium]